jgi:Cu(I)/Ag(I) efflux system periplasmic protein CusF
MKKILLAVAALVLSMSAWAQAPTTKGEVTKIDKPGGRVTLKHDEIRNLDMPAMTMVYRVSNPELLDGLAVGSRIRFTAERVNGQYTVTSISKAP